MAPPSRNCHRGSGACRIRCCGVPVAIAIWSISWPWSGLHDEQAVLAAVELALSDGVATKTHVLNILHRLIDGKPTDGPTISTPQTLLLRHEPKANVERYDDLRTRSAGGRHAS